MGKTRPPYPGEFREQIVEMVRAGGKPVDLSKEFGPSPASIRAWVRQADLDDGLRDDGLTTDEREELNRLRRDNRRLKLERDILAKATAWFARETGSEDTSS
jgi:transposase